MPCRTSFLFIILLLIGYACPAAEPDTDGDGLSDAVERSIGTDPAKADTDGDGYYDGPDVWVDLGKEGLVIHAGEDQNGDGKYEPKGPDGFVDTADDEFDPKKKRSHPEYKEIRVVDKNRNHIPDSIEEMGERHGKMAAEWFGDDPKEVAQDIIKDYMYSLGLKESPKDPEEAFAKASPGRVADVVMGAEEISKKTNAANEGLKAQKAALSPAQVVVGNQLGQMMFPEENTITNDQKRLMDFQSLPREQQEALMKQAMSKATPHNTDPACIADKATRAAYDAVQAKMATVKAYKATIAKDNLSLFANLTPATQEIHGMKPEKFKTEQTLEKPAGVGVDIDRKIVAIADQGWMYSILPQIELTAEQKKQLGEFCSNETKKDDARYKTPEERQTALKQMIEYYTEKVTAPQGQKGNVVALAQTGDVTIPEYLAAMGDLFHPFEQYRLDTLKLEQETPEVWVFSGQCNYAMIPWASTRVTIDKKTGLMSKIQSSIEQFEQGKTAAPINEKSLVTLLEVKKVEVLSELPDSTFDSNSVWRADSQKSIADITDSFIGRLRERVASVKLKEYLRDGGSLEAQEKEYKLVK